jgi:hypothetical protein
VRINASLHFSRGVGSAPDTGQIESDKLKTDKMLMPLMDLVVAELNSNGVY